MSNAQEEEEEGKINIQSHNHYYNPQECCYKVQEQLTEAMSRG